jgi:hypothetical protein
MVHSVTGTGWIGLISGTAACLIVYFLTLGLVGREALAETWNVVRKVAESSLHRWLPQRLSPGIGVATGE